MDYARSTRTPAAAVAGARRAKPKTGPLPTVPWRDLDRKHSLEHHLPALILLSFALLGLIQFLLTR